MNAALENSPLVELVAELRWLPRAYEGVQMQPGMPVMIPMQSSEADNFFMRFGLKVNEFGYSQAERQVPPGFPVALHQAVYRFKHSDHERTGSLYQVGNGALTINAVPPYESWEASIEGVIRQGIEAVLATRPPEDAKQPFVAASVRYVDVFEHHLTEGRSVHQFLRDVLGIDIVVPESLSKHLIEGEQPKPVIQLQIPMSKGQVMSLAVGEGAAGPKKGIVMDTSVATSIQIAPTLDAAMEALNGAHAAIRSSFFDLIKPIAHLMPPKKAAK